MLFKNIIFGWLDIPTGDSVKSRNDNTNLSDSKDNYKSKAAEEKAHERWRDDDIEDDGSENIQRIHHEVIHQDIMDVKVVSFPY
jgi:hypothetical protein